MGFPDENRAGYQSASVLTHVSELSGELLVIHGMVDENVHFRHTARLVEALIQEGKTFELLPFPEERHMPRSEAGRLYMEQRLVEHFRRSLGVPRPLTI
jgi:dipeptidyl-peptidase-4